MNNFEKMNLLGTKMGDNNTFQTKIIYINFTTSSNHAKEEERRTLKWVSTSEYFGG